MSPVVAIITGLFYEVSVFPTAVPVFRISLTDE